MVNQRAFRLRAILALGFLFFFYAMAVVAALALPTVPFFLYVLTDRVVPSLALACLVGSAAIVLGIVPRGSRFREPGPGLLEGFVQHITHRALPQLADVREIVAFAPDGADRLPPSKSADEQGAASP
jgi:hypothetical protein